MHVRNRLYASGIFRLPEKVDCPMMGPILIAGEDAGRRSRLGSTLISAGYRIIEAESGYRAFELLRRRQNIALALIELEMSDISGVNFIASIRSSGIKVALIVLANNENDGRLHHAIDSGANDFLVYPVSGLRLTVSVGNLLQRHILERKLQFLRRHTAVHLSFADLVVKSDAMKQLVRDAENAAKSKRPLLITGEIGTGREALARIIHNESSKSKGPFVHIRCSYHMDQESSSKSWPDELANRLEEAQGGTFFLSDVDALDTVFQSQLMQMLEQQGKMAKSHRNTGFHLMATASTNLTELVDEGSFLAGLYKRLGEIELKTPPLRNRREDIPDLANLILTRIITETGHARISGLSGGARELLLQHDWPGNIMELENVLFRAVLLSDGPLLSVQDFPQLVQHNQGKDNTSAISSQVFFDASGHILPLTVIEKHAIDEAMKRYRGKISEVARRLHIGRSTLYRKLEEYNFNTRHKT